MPRKPQVRYFASRSGFYCQIAGKQHPLASGPDDSPHGPTYLAALTAFRRLLAGGQAEQAGDTNTVRTVCNLYLNRTRAAVEASTQTRRSNLLKPFMQSLGDVRVCDLTPLRVEGFVSDMQTPHPVHRGAASVCTVSWSASTVTSFISAASAAFAWAIEQKLTTTNPMRNIRRPGIRSRGRDCVVSPEQHETILRLCRSEGMKRIIIALENTGARPGEILAATARDFDPAKGAIIYYADSRRQSGEFRHKSAKHKDRLIFFHGNALEMVKGLAARWTAGPLFRKSDNSHYTTTAIQMYFVSFRERKTVNMPGLTAYSYRHTFATRWLLSGRSIEILAELLGNTPNVIRRHYAHLCGDWQAVRSHLDGFHAE